MLLVCAHDVRAQGQPTPPPAPPDTGTDQARSLFNDGTEKARRGDWSVALTSFERSEALRPHAVTTYNIGYCERALGRYTRAREILGRALAENVAHGGAELPDDLASAAKTYLAELERQIARAVVSISVEGATVLVDGRPLERAATDGPRPVLWAGTRDLGAAEAPPASTFELQIDPGPHAFVVSKAGYVDDVTTRSFEAGTPSTVAIELKVAAPAGPAPEASSALAERHAQSPNRAPIYISLVIAAGALATGATAGAIAIDLKGEGNAHYGSAGTAADVSTVAFVVGGVGAATGAILWLLSPKDTSRSSGAAGRTRFLGELRVAPIVIPGGAGVVGTW